jgi:hypothetical protein
MICDTYFYTVFTEYELDVKEMGNEIKYEHQLYLSCYKRPQCPAISAPLCPDQPVLDTYLSFEFP